MKIVEFTAKINNTTNTIELPDDPGLFTSIHIDSATNRVQAVYTGNLDHLPLLDGKEIPKWDTDTRAWKDFNDRRYRLTKKEFNLLFSPTEYQAIVERLPTDYTLAQLWDVLQIVDYIDLEDPVTVNGMMYLTAIGALTVGRYEEMMRGLPQDGKDPALIKG